MDLQQSIINRAVNIATKAALDGRPVKRIVWIPPSDTTQSADGCFAIEYVEGVSADKTPPWERG